MSWGRGDRIIAIRRVGDTATHSPLASAGRETINKVNILSKSKPVENELDR